MIRILIQIGVFQPFDKIKLDLSKTYVVSKHFIVSVTTQKKTVKKLVTMSFTKNVTETLRVAPDFQVWVYSLPASLLTSVNFLKSVVLAIVQTQN